MKYFKRLEEPDFLLRTARRWIKQWTNLKGRKPGALFQWYKYEGLPVNQHLCPLLARQTQDHCSYCDAFPARAADETIDHFRPKSDIRFYDQTYSWGNLYFACSH